MEALPLKIDDNILIPLSVGISLWALYIWLLPAVKSYAMDVIVLVRVG